MLDNPHESPETAPEDNRPNHPAEIAADPAVPSPAEAAAAAAPPPVETPWYKQAAEWVPYVLGGAGIIAAIILGRNFPGPPKTGY